MRLFVEANGWRWRSQPEIDDAETIVLAIADGSLDEAGTAEWLRAFLVPSRDA